MTTMDEQATTNTSRPESTVSATEPDWTRERVKPFAWEPNRRLLRAVRDYQHEEHFLIGTRLLTSTGPSVARGRCRCGGGPACGRGCGT